MKTSLLIFLIVITILFILFQIIYKRKEEKIIIEKEKMNKIEDERRYRRERNILIRNGQRKRGKSRC